MTYTIADQCASLRLESTIIDDFVTDNPSHDYSVNITFTKNCSTNFSFDIVIGDIDDSGLINFIEYLPEDLGGTTSIPDGVYSVVITKTLDDLSEITTEKECIVIDCELKCCVIDYLADNPSSDIMLYYTALTWAPNCGNCLCDEACTLYNLILDKLDENGSTTQCGCSG